MRLGALLKRLDLWLRPAHVHGEGRDERPVDNDTALATMSGHVDGMGAPVDAPPNWVPSQQDWGRPH